MLSSNDERTLLWLASDHAFTLTELIRFCHVTGTVSDIDRSLLLGRLVEIENLLKRVREEKEIAIPKRFPTVPQARPKA